MVIGEGSGIGIGMTESGTGRPKDCILGDMRLRAPPIIGDLAPIIGDLGLSMPTTDGGRTPPTTEEERVGGPPAADPGRGGTTEPMTEPETEGGRGTRAARLVCEPMLLLVLERGGGGMVGY